MSVSIQAQLKPLGFDIKLQQTQDYGGVIKSRDFDALIVSFNSVQTGDPLFQLARSVGKDGGLNWGSYSNPQIDDLLTQLSPVKVNYHLADQYQHDEVAASGYNCGIDAAITGAQHGDSDKHTTGKDYGRDVVTRMAIFEELIAEGN